MVMDRAYVNLFKNFSCDAHVFANALTAVVPNSNISGLALVSPRCSQ